MTALSPTSFIDCLAFGYNLTPWACIQNQLGLVLPIHPCWECKRPVIIEEKLGEKIPPKSPKPLPGMTLAVARALGKT
jgi:hypothetical protein